MPSEHPPVGHSPIASPGGVALLLLREGILQGQVEVLIRTVAEVVERRLVLHLVVVLHRVVFLHHVVVLHRLVDVARAGCCISRWTWCHYVRAPCYQINGEPRPPRDVRPPRDAELDNVPPPDLPCESDLPPVPEGFPPSGEAGLTSPGETIGE